MQCGALYPLRTSDWERAGVSGLCPCLSPLPFLKPRVLTSCASHLLPDMADRAARVTSPTSPLQLEVMLERSTPPPQKLHSSYCRSPAAQVPVINLLLPMWSPCCFLTCYWQHELIHSAVCISLPWIGVAVFLPTGRITVLTVIRQILMSNCSE